MAKRLPKNGKWIISIAKIQTTESMLSTTDRARLGSVQQNMKSAINLVSVQRDQFVDQILGLG